MSRHLPEGALAWPRVSMLALAAVTLALSGCTGTVEDPNEPRPVTTEEAELLAVSIAQIPGAGTREVTLEVPGEAPRRMDGWIDFTVGEGYGVLSDPTDETELAMVRWTGDMVATRAGIVTPPLPVPFDGWEVSALDPELAPELAAFAAVLDLGAERIDNPDQPQDSGARWLGEEEVNGAAVAIFAGPCAEPGTELTRYWIDEHGVTIRAQIRHSPDDTDWIVVGVGAQAEVDFGARPPGMEETE